VRVVSDRDETDPVWFVRLEPSSGPDREPARSVALDAEGLRELLVLLVAAEASPSCRVLVIESAGPDFCRGMDLGAIRREAGQDQVDNLKRYAECMLRLTTCTKAVCSVVDGPVMGGGVGLVAAADVVIATEAAEFSLPECTFGLIPAMVMPLLARRMPPQKAQWLALAARALDVHEAHRLGLVDTVVRRSELQRALRRQIKGWLRMGPSAISRLGRFSETTAGLPLAEALSCGVKRTAEDLLETETLGAIEAFFTGELPSWFVRYKGRRADDR